MSLSENITEDRNKKDSTYKLSDVESYVLDEIRQLEQEQVTMSSSEDFEVERVIAGMFDNEKMYRTPSEAEESAEDWRAKELGGPDALRKIWLFLKESRD